MNDICQVTTPKSRQPSTVSAGSVLVFPSPMQDHHRTGDTRRKYVVFATQKAGCLACDTIEMPRYVIRPCFLRSKSIEFAAVLA